MGEGKCRVQMDGGNLAILRTSACWVLESKHISTTPHCTLAMTLIPDNTWTTAVYPEILLQVP